MTGVALAGPRPIREAGLITLGHALTHWYPATFYILLPIIGRELGLSYTQIGLVMSVQSLAGAVANIPGGMVVDMVGKKSLLMATSLFWVGFPYLLMSFTHSYVMLLVCVALVGFGNSLWHPTAIPALAERYPEKKGLMISVHGMGGNVGDACAPLAIGTLLAVFTWRDVMVINVVPGILMSIAIMVMLGSLRAAPRLTPAPQRGLTDYLAGVRALLGSRALAMLSASSAFRTMTVNCLLTFLPVYLANEMGYSTLLVGLAMFVLQAAGFIAAPIAGHLSDRLGPAGVMTGAMIASAALLVVMALAGGTTLFVVLIALLGFFLYATRPVIQAWLLDCTPKDMGGTSIGVLFMAQAIGSSVAPVLAGVIADRWGLAATFHFLASTIVVGNLFLIGVPARAVAKEL